MLFAAGLKSIIYAQVSQTYEDAKEGYFARGGRAAWGEVGEGRSNARWLWCLLLGESAAEGGARGSEPSGGGRAGRGLAAGVRLVQGEGGLGREYLAWLDHYRHRGLDLRRLARIFNWKVIYGNYFTKPISLSPHVKLLRFTSKK